MEKEDLINFLRDNLRLEYEKSGGAYGSHEFKEMKLMLGEEEISSIWIDD